MEGGIDVDAPLDYADFQISPSQNSHNESSGPQSSGNTKLQEDHTLCIQKVSGRSDSSIHFFLYNKEYDRSFDQFEAFVFCDNRVETLASGHLEQLLLHFPKVKDLCSKRSNFKFQLQPPDNVIGAQWFTKSTLTRFLSLVGSPDKFDSAKAISKEISQLEETRRFHLSLYTKAEVDTAPSDASKNELLRAMDLRLTALRKELAAAFDQAAGVFCSLKEITDLENFSHHVGDIDLRNSLCKFEELSQKRQNFDVPIENNTQLKNELTNDRANNTERSTQTSKASHSVTPVKYGVSPAKAAQVERQTSSESEESSYSSEDRPSVERSRQLIRSASPRRSASPMRRIQIGRSGSRKATALTIKSLNFVPAREKFMAHRDAAASSSDEEGSEQQPKKPERNVRRMSVQDAISLFESKQRDPTLDPQKTTLSLNASVGANKAVLRRWSSGMGESSTQCVPEIISDRCAPTTTSNLAGGEIPKSSEEVKPEPDLAAGGYNPVETAELCVNLDSSELSTSKQTSMQADAPETLREESSEKLSASAEWSRKKEVELNQLMMKMMESKPVRYQNTGSDTNKSQTVPKEPKGGFYDQYKEKRDERLREAAVGKRAEKEAQFRALQQILDESKTEMFSATANNVDRRQTVCKPQKARKSLPHTANPNTETSKPPVVKKTSPKSIPLPAMRKSWPSTPSPRATGTSPAKTPPGATSAVTTTTRRKSQPAPVVPRSSLKVDRSQPQPKIMKATKNDTLKSTKGVKEKQQKTEAEKKQQTLTKNGKTTKPKVHTASGEHLSTTKPRFYSKVTKKSSVVPLESKPFLRKGSGVGPIKTKSTSQPEESLRNPVELIQTEGNEEVVMNTSDLVSQQLETNLEVLEIPVESESETRLSNGPQKCEDTDSTNQFTASADDSFARMTESVLTTEAEEISVISPSAWVEIEELPEESIPYHDSSSQIASLTHVAPMAWSSPRVRHSLSQMLLEESSEPDISEWGIAENPPSMILQKDSPKGLKRLLKFARKSKADANLSGWPSPSRFSEGEDSEDSGAVGKRYAVKETSSYEKNSAAHEISAQSRKSKFDAQSSARKLQDGHVSTSTKATRSFFSLSAFRGNKLNETRHP